MTNHVNSGIVDDKIMLTFLFFYLGIFCLRILGVEPLTNFSKKVGEGGLDRISIFRGGLLGKMGRLFSGGVAVFT